jgi:peptidoglycan/LPS O-acetylase OafA/YrhL
MIASITPSTRARLNSLTGVRFAAALIVFLYHAGYYLPAGELRIFGAGMAGVSLFYVLSGFVMAWVFRPDDRPSQFYRRRFARVYPAYFVAVTATIVVSLVMRDFSIPELAAYTLLQSWSPDPSVHYAASPVFWSLSCEAFFYAMFPLLAGRFARASSRNLWLVVLASIAAVVLIGTVSSFFWDEGVVRWLAYIFPPSRFVEFVLGVALGFLVHRGFRSPVPVWAAGVLSLAAALLASSAPGGLKFAAITVIPFAILVVSLASSDAEGKQARLASRPIVALGVWSYCFYLIHAMLQGWVVHTGAYAGLPAFPSLLIALSVAVFGAWTLHVVVERRAEVWLRPPRSAPRLDTE